ncbi:MAG: hypothetical protein U0350_28750 [Caldilineaceae bacterium]
MSNNQLPQYVEYGAVVTTPTPLLCQNATLYTFLLEADYEKLKNLCQRVFSTPTQGAIEYYPLTRYVALVFGDMAVRSTVEPYCHWGIVQERSASIWVMTAAVRRQGDLLIAERFAGFLPYIMMDSALSLIGGREIYGFPKSWGWPQMPATPTSEPTNFSCDVLGTNFGPTNRPQRHPLFELNRLEGVVSRGSARELTTLADFLHEIQGVLFAHDQAGNMLIPGLELAEDLFDEMLAHQTRQVFLKQFRSATESLAACYQAIIEAQAKVTEFKAVALLPSYQFVLHPLDSHPIFNELGLQNQAVNYGFRVDLSFEEERGSIIWQADAG